MSSWRALLAIGIGAYVLFVLLTFPARVALDWLAPEALEASGVSGTIWSGTARATGIDGVPLGELEWSFRPLTLFDGRLGYAIRAQRPDGFLRSDVALGPSGMRLAGLTGKLPIQALAQSLPLGNMSGEVIVEFEELSLADGWPQHARGTVSLTSVTVSVPATPPIIEALGNYQIAFTGEQEGEDLEGALRQLSGPLSVQGTLVLGADRSYLIEGRVAARSDASADLARMLQVLGSPESDGRRPFSFAGRL